MISTKEKKIQPLILSFGFKRWGSMWRMTADLAQKDCNTLCDQWTGSYRSSCSCGHSGACSRYERSWFHDGQYLNIWRGCTKTKQHSNGSYMLRVYDLGSAHGCVEIKNRSHTQSIYDRDAGIHQPVGRLQAALTAKIICTSSCWKWRINLW